MLTIKQGVFGMTRAGIKTQVSWTIGEHSNHETNVLT